MAMFQFPISLNPGSQMFGPINVDDDTTRIVVSLANWPQQNRTIALFVEGSYDTGQTWEQFPSMNPTPGARTTDPRHPDAGTDCGIIIDFAVATPGRLLRVTPTVTGGRIDTLLTITTS
jgi:hypothetical protein